LNYYKKNILKVILFLLFFLLTLEICARVEDSIRYDACFFCDYTFANMLYIYDEYGKVGKPNSRFQKYQLNNIGFRGDDIELIKAKHVRRIVCVGASETFGYFETEKSEWPAQLAKILDTNKRVSYEVINTSLPGRRLKANITHLRKRVLRLNPDIVIFIPFGLHYMDPDFKKHSMKKRKKVKSDSNSFSISSRLKPKIRQSIKHFVPDSLRKSVARYEGLSKLRKKLDEKGYAPFVDTISSDQLQLCKKDLETFYNICMDNKVKLILGTVALHLSEKNLIEAWRYYPFLTKNGFKEGDKKINQMIKTFSEEKQIPYVDLANLVPKDDLHLGDYIHYTDKGAEIVAKAFADAIFSEN
jgi:lysophospholipase L1-like esterase